MLLRGFPWKQVISWFARTRGFVDPVSLLSRLERFGQPADVKAPMELVRSGVLFHARGLLNTGAIQHNLDWVWPYWVVRQYDPHDVSFIPRAFSITHVNLTHRNWTAVGAPGLDWLPIVDPCGLLTPFWDSWSVDAWIVTPGGPCLFPSCCGIADQDLEMGDTVAVRTLVRQEGLELHSRVWLAAAGPECRLELTARSPTRGEYWLAVALRPYNPEGVSFIHRIQALDDDDGWLVDNRARVLFSRPAPRMAFAYYRQGDVKNRLFTGGTAADQRAVHCRTGMATGAALFPLDEGTATVTVRIPYTPPRAARGRPAVPQSWQQALAGAAPLAMPDPHHAFLYQAALRSLVLHTPGEVYPGPFTYKRFWFRDAVFIASALLAGGLVDRVERILDTFPARQRRNGFFHSQEGEWDANGQVLWLFHRYCRMTGRPPNPAWRRAIRRGARWLRNKLLPATPASPFAGLLPAGFSAEHLGPNDYYYWDDFWAVAGLRSAAWCLAQLGEEEAAAEAAATAESLQRALDESLARCQQRLGTPAMPASPYRRLDAGAIGSLAGGYPTQVLAGDDPRLLATADYLARECLVDGGFFQDVIHSGVNAYLTLHLAQVLLRAGDRRGLDLVQRVAELASPTGQWPEAIHPRTGGGCMGDGHHVWAAAEWLLAVRYAFIREEEGEETLVLGAGIMDQWLAAARRTADKTMVFGPAPTLFGPVRVAVTVTANNRVQLTWEGDWRQPPAAVVVALPGRRPTRYAPTNRGNWEDDDR